ncbi:MAG: hypothetical protein LBQ40_05865 [Clostridiales bacterium]|jgi:hypothetical protein|nr:hypothetical protein [Clostridiales bacterium]
MGDADAKKIRNSFLISFALIIAGNAAFYLFDVGKYGAYVNLILLSKTKLYTKA